MQVDYSTSENAVSAGLWETNPDVDALTNLVGLSGPCNVTRHESMVLGNNIVCPFNTQNTAYFSQFWLTAFLSPYVGRYDDTLSSYIAKRIADHFGYGICFGESVVIQDHNQHDFYQDLRGELYGMAFTDSFVFFLYSVSLSPSSIIDCYQQIIDALRNHYQEYEFDFNIHSLAQPWSMTKMIEGMQIWLDTLDIVRNVG